MCGGVATPPEPGGVTYLSQRSITMNIQSTSWPLTQKQLSLSCLMGPLHFYVSQRYFKRPSLYLTGGGTLTIILKKTAKTREFECGANMSYSKSLQHNP